MEWALLRGLPEEHRQRLLDHSVPRRYARGEVVFHEGDVGDTLHLLCKGRVCVRASTPMGDVATFAVLGPGDFFGEQALLAGRHERTATIVALEQVETRALPRAAFEQLRQVHPSIERLLVEVLAGQVRRLSSHLLEALFLPAEKRVARRLVVLAHQYGVGAPGGPRAGEGGVSSEVAAAPVVIPLTQEDLASLAGTTRPTVNRVLRDMQADGAVQLRRGRIEIHDLRAIRRRAS